MEPMYELAAGAVIGLFISVALVKRSSQKAFKSELTWLQAAKVVLVRTVVALGVGFILGRGIAWGIESEVISQSALKEHSFILVTAVLLCAAASFLAFQWVVGRLTGKPVSILQAAKGICIETGYFLVVMFALFVLVVSGLFIIEFFF